jgi:hypothetical protein
MSVSEKLTKAIRKISPPLAAKMRPPVSSGTRGRPLKGAVYICGKDRRFFVVGLISGMQLDDHPWFSSKLFFRCCQEDRDLREGEKC